ncbi:MAG: phosphate ABC transporter substrate-binding protein PstS [Pseudomonadota bacterium]
MPSNFQFASCVVTALSLIAPAVQASEVLGAGASLPAPVYAKWAKAYKLSTGNKVVYQSIGSGSGVAQITAKSVDFGTSDSPLSGAVLEKNGLLQFPTLLGGVVPIVNLPNTKPGDVKLTGPVLADIYLGKIVTWDDSAITQLNPGVSLPNLAIAVVRRSDSSGSTLLFTDYLSKVSPEWKTRLGRGVTVPWTVGLGGKGDEGVSKFVQRLPGAIGFVDYGYALNHNLPYTQLKNQSGAFVSPSPQSLAAAVSSNWENSGFSDILTEERSAGAWPITGATFALIRKVQDKPDQAREIIKFFAWAFKEGDKSATESNYVPLTESTTRAVAALWQVVRDPTGKPIYE